MKFYLLDDDKNILNILNIIFEDKSLGHICGKSDNPEIALEEIVDCEPDIIIVDLLMPIMDGITFMNKAKLINSNLSFIMLSQVSSKDMIAEAYESGIEFFIQKPLNSIEIENVVKKVANSLYMNRTFNKIQNLFQNEAYPKTNINNESIKGEKEHISKLKNILHRMGILGELGSKDIINLLDYLVENDDDVREGTLDNLCSKFSSNPKAIEQRIRRAAISGLVNIANMGVEDYSNDIFVEYSATIYNFEQVKKEMDYIRGKSNKHGKVLIKNFLNGLLAYIKE